MTTFLLNSGHGEDTKGKRSPFIPPGVHEWKFNSKLVTYIQGYAPEYCVKTVHLDPGFTAVPLVEIVARANDFYKVDSDCIFVSVHANADGDGAGWTEANGSAVFVSPSGSEASIRFAGLLAPRIAEAGYFRNRGVREANFKVLNKTRCPAVLSENGFMTHSADATKIASPYWVEKIARAHLEAMALWNCLLW